MPMRLVLGGSQGGKPVPPSGAAFGCLLLFALPFAGFGLFAGVQVIQKLAAGDLRSAAFLALFAAVFGGVGVGLAAAAVYGRREADRRARAAATHPDEPWLWREDWAAGRIEDGGRKGQYVAWILATFWNLVSFPSALIAMREVSRHGNRLALIALIFPAIGLVLLGAAIRSSLRVRKFGLSSLELSTRPGVIGHGLAGTVHIASVLLPPGGFLARLSCVNLRTTGSGDSRSTSEFIRWEEEQQVAGERQAVGPSRGIGTAIPIHFRVPVDASPSDDSNADDRIVWRLAVKAAVPGVDYAATFEVPVFRTAASAIPLTATEEELLGPAPEALPYRQPPGSPIRVSTGPRGTQIVFPPARNAAVALGVTAFAALCGAVLWLIVAFKAPVIFPVVFGLAELVLLYSVLRMWLRVVEVVASRDGVAIATGYGVVGDPVMITARDVTGVEVKIAFQAGSSLYYAISILQAGGRRTGAGSGIRDKREAEWLAGLIKAALHMDPPAPRA